LGAVRFLNLFFDFNLNSESSLFRSSVYGHLGSVHGGGSSSSTRYMHVDPLGVPWSACLLPVVFCRKQLPAFSPFALHSLLANNICLFPIAIFLAESIGFSIVVCSSLFESMLNLIFSSFFRLASLPPAVPILSLVISPAGLVKGLSISGEVAVFYISPVHLAGVF